MKKQMYYKFNLYLKGVFLVGFMAVTMYYSNYNVNNSLVDIQKAVNKEVNAGLPLEAFNVKLSQELDIEDRKYVSGVVNDSFAVIELKKGINNYKIDHMSYGTDLFEIKFFSKAKNNYIVAQCKSSEEKIAYIKFNIDDEDYRIDMKNEGDFFMGYCKSEEPIKNVGYILKDLKFFNNDDEDVTDKVELTKLEDSLSNLMSRKVVIK